MPATYSRNERLEAPLEEDLMKLALLGLIALGAVSLALPASAMPVAPLATSSASSDLVLVRHGGHGHHFGWHHGHGHHYGFVRGRHHGW